MKSRYIAFKPVRNTVIITLIIMLILFIVPSPFVVMRPGIAVPVEQFVQHDETNAEGGQAAAHDEGKLLLTAVLLTAPPMLDSLKAFFIKEQDVYWKRDVLGGSSLAKFAERVNTMMEGSHHDALEAAYRYLGIGYDVATKALIVQQPSTHELARAALKAGDKITGIKLNSGINVTEMQSITSMISWLRQQDEQMMTIELERDQEKKELQVNWLESDKKLTDEQITSVVLGIQDIIELRGIVPHDKKHQLNILTDNIGGPSAGLAFALQIISELTETDLTKGRIVAVTGTISPDGKVGPIGGIRQKVVSVNEQGAQLFIVPAENEKEAKQMLKRLNTDMEVVGVAHLEEAMSLLASY